MKAHIQSYSSGHLVEKYLFAMILAQENGKTLHCHLGGRMEGKIIRLGEGGMVQVDQNVSKNLLRSQAEKQMP
jgi:hypothetical protein